MFRRSGYLVFMADLSNDIETNAVAPKRVKTDEGEFDQHSLKEQIEADRYLQGKAASRASGFGLRVARVKSPSALGE